MLLPEYSLSTLNTIHHMDALSLLRGLRSNSIDAIITDPPYGHNNGQGDLAGARAMAFVQSGRQSGAITAIANDSPEVYQSMMTQLLIEVNRVLKSDGALALFCAGGGSRPTFANLALWIDAHCSFFHAVVWNKSARGYGLGWRYRRNYEFVMVGHKRGGKLRWADERSAQPNLVDFRPVPNEIHPTQKPLDLMEWLVLNHTNLGDTVIDPFIGSGTTLIAARRLGRNFIGCDLNADYVALARRRLIETDPFQHKPLPNGMTQMSLFPMAQP